ncbi:unnamed protein product [Aspergillus oryzae]|nr:unnamed protein product [Aspergillus oryzae]GMF94889.1 unnamed protein product [Aspergillus oryzae]
MQTISVDVLVCGGGMSGMACAAFAAESGAKVLVVEKQAVVGGSSNYSAGMLYVSRRRQVQRILLTTSSWAPKNYNSLRSWVPDGDPELQAAWMKDYLPAKTIYIRADNETGIGFPIKIPQLHLHHQQRIHDNNIGSQIFTNTAVVKLLQEQPGVPGSRIVGAIIRRGPGDGAGAVYYEVKAQHAVLATGGFQGNTGLTSMHLGQGGDNIFVRSNRGSVGDGLTLATAVGAGTSRGMNTYYGYLLAAPLRSEAVDPKNFLSLAQYRIPTIVRAPGYDPCLAKVLTLDRITFTYGGVLINAEGRALTPDKTPIPGLLIAGVDGGGFSNLGYAGGLALAFVTGLWAARTIATELKLPVPQLPAADLRDAGPHEDPVIASRL